MRLSDLLKCVRPLLFEDGFEGFEYSGGGTFFFARFGGKFFGITAKHCLRDRNKEAIRLLLNDAPKGAELVPLRTLHTIDDPPDGIADWADLAFMELRDESLTPSQKKADWFVNFDHLVQLGTAKLIKNDLLVTRGCPNCLGQIDYEVSKILTGFFAVDGVYNGPGVDPKMHIFNFSDLSQIANPNGMSGSPVFKVRETNQSVDYWFAGVILRSTKLSGVAHFVECSVVYEALRQIKSAASH